MFGIRRFGSSEVQSSQSGASRLSKFFANLNGDGETKEENDNESNKSGSLENVGAIKYENKEEMEEKTTNAADKRELEEIGEEEDEPPKKKQKLITELKASNNEDNKAKNVNVNMNMNEDPWGLNDLFSMKNDGKVEASNKNSENVKKNKNGKNNSPYHPIYQITNFPKPKLPALMNIANMENESDNENEKESDKPIWMQQTKSLLIDNLKENEMKQENGKKIESHFRFDQRLLNVLINEGYNEYFPCQLKVIPSIMNGYNMKRDIAVCAPTGSGKTLAYALPICQILCNNGKNVNSKNGLQALIVAPSRDLAKQIDILMSKLCNSIGIKCGLSAGQRSFADESKLLFYKNTFTNENEIVDILICTPGRLMDHLDHTINFSLNDLKFLILDEADRLSNENTFQDWLYRIHLILDNRDNCQFYKNNIEYWHNNLWNNYDSLLLQSREYLNKRQKKLMKILVSATLTHNPRIIASLNLHYPLYLNASSNKKYLIPTNLTQYKIVLVLKRKKIEKLVYFLGLIDLLKSKNESALIFCNKKNTAHRLRRLVQIVFDRNNNENGMHSILSHEFSSNIPQRQRSKVLRQFRGKKIQFLFCSDAMSRGLDVPHLDCVINYQQPSNMKTYVHRVGRTARGLHSGKCFTLVESKYEISFDNMLDTAENGIANHFYLSQDLIQHHMKLFDQYMDKLDDILAKEKRGHLDIMRHYFKNQAQTDIDESTKPPLLDDTAFMTDSIF